MAVHRELLDPATAFQMLFYADRRAGHLSTDRSPSIRKGDRMVRRELRPAATRRDDDVRSTMHKIILVGTRSHAADHESGAPA